MGIKTHEVVTHDEKSHYAWWVWCPACDAPHSFDDRWTLSGTHEAPSFMPSMLVHEYAGSHARCHSFLKDGVWQFLGDCTHSSAGQHVEAPDWASTRFGKDA